MPNRDIISSSAKEETNNNNNNNNKSSRAGSSPPQRSVQEHVTSRTHVSHFTTASGVNVQLLGVANAQLRSEVATKRRMLRPEAIITDVSAKILATMLPNRRKIELERLERIEERYKKRLENYIAVAKIQTALISHQNSVADSALSASAFSPSLEPSGLVGRHGNSANLLNQQQQQPGLFNFNNQQQSQQQPDSQKQQELFAQVMKKAASKVAADAAIAELYGNNDKNNNMNSNAIKTSSPQLHNLLFRSPSAKSFASSPGLTPINKSNNNNISGNVRNSRNNNHVGALSSNIISSGAATNVKDGIINNDSTNSQPLSQSHKQAVSLSGAMMNATKLISRSLKPQQENTTNNGNNDDNHQNKNNNSSKKSENDDDDEKEDDKQKSHRRAIAGTVGGRQSVFNRISRLPTQNPGYYVKLKELGKGSCATTYLVEWVPPGGKSCLHPYLTPNMILGPHKAKERCANFQDAHLDYCLTFVEDESGNRQSLHTNNYHENVTSPTTKDDGDLNRDNSNISDKNEGRDSEYSQASTSRSRTTSPAKTKFRKSLRPHHRMFLPSRFEEDRDFGQYVSLFGQHHHQKAKSQNIIKTDSADYVNTATNDEKGKRDQENNNNNNNNNQGSNKSAEPQNPSSRTQSSSRRQALVLPNIERKRLNIIPKGSEDHPFTKQYGSIPASTTNNDNNNNNGEKDSNNGTISPSTTASNRNHQRLLLLNQTATSDGMMKSTATGSYRRHQQHQQQSSRHFFYGSGGAISGSGNSDRTGANHNNSNNTNEQNHPVTEEADGPGDDTSSSAAPQTKKFPPLAPSITRHNSNNDNDDTKKKNVFCNNPNLWNEVYDSQLLDFLDEDCYEPSRSVDENDKNDATSLERTSSKITEKKKDDDNDERKNEKQQVKNDQQQQQQSSSKPSSPTNRSGSNRRQQDRLRQSLRRAFSAPPSLTSSPRFDRRHHTISKEVIDLLRPGKPSTLSVTKSTIALSLTMEVPLSLLENFEEYHNNNKNLTVNRNNSGITTNNTSFSSARSATNAQKDSTLSSLPVQISNEVNSTTSASAAIRRVVPQSPATSPQSQVMIHNSSEAVNNSLNDYELAKLLRKKRALQTQTKTIRRTVEVQRENVYVCKAETRADSVGYTVTPMTERAVLSTCAHPNIVGYIDHFSDELTEYLIMEFVDGGDLKQMIKQRTDASSANQQQQQQRNSVHGNINSIRAGHGGGNNNNNGDIKYLSERSVLFLFVQMVMSVEYCHRFNILHRDIKTANFISSKKWLIKLADFGFAKMYGDKINNLGNQDVDLEVTVTSLGTPFFMAPEMIATRKLPARSVDVETVAATMQDGEMNALADHNAGYGDRADIWALGVCLYELISMSKPFPGPSVDDVIQHVLHRDPAPLPRNTSNGSFYCSDEVRSLLAAMLHKNPKKRPSAKEILQYSFMQDAMKRFVDKYEDAATTTKCHQDIVNAQLLREHQQLVMADKLSGPKSTKKIRREHRESVQGMMGSIMSGVSRGVLSIVESGNIHNDDDDDDDTEYQSTNSSV